MIISHTERKNIRIVIDAQKDNLKNRKGRICTKTWKKLQLEKSNCRRRDKWKKLKIEVRQKK